MAAEGKVTAFVDVDERERCPICDWPMAKSREEGCVPGDCCYRPEFGTAEHRRIEQNRARIQREKETSNG